ncbi:hypothetical protein BOX15_Mlig031198g1, partial [Macrostomum lignano]
NMAMSDKTKLSLTSSVLSSKLAMPPKLNTSFGLKPASATAPTIGSTSGFGTSLLSSTALSTTRPSVLTGGGSSLAANRPSGASTSLNLQLSLGTSTALRTAPPAASGYRGAATSAATTTSLAGISTTRGVSTKLDKDRFNSAMRTTSAAPSAFSARPAAEVPEPQPAAPRSADQSEAAASASFSLVGHVTSCIDAEKSAPNYSGLKFAEIRSERLRAFAGKALLDTIEPTAFFSSLANRKRLLLNMVSASLIRAPDFKDTKDSLRCELMQLADSIAREGGGNKGTPGDPEFILKVALFTRKELNIRTTANFLLSYSAVSNLTRPYIKKYFSAAVALPSDWIEVAEIYQAFHDRTLRWGALPAALRKAMVAKFPDFDAYQLGKYNKEKAVKKKAKKADGQATAGAATAL